jgi:hypothetical protein
MLTFTVSPLLNQKGYTATVTWSTTLVTSCTVTSNAGDSWTGTSGTKTSLPINGQTTFTAKCTGNDGSTLTQSATVNLIPVFCEPGATGC